MGVRIRAGPFQEPVELEQGIVGPAIGNRVSEPRQPLGKGRDQKSRHRLHASGEVPQAGLDEIGAGERAGVS